MLSAGLGASAQKPDSLNAQQRRELIYHTLDPAPITTGVLLDRTVPFSRLDRFNGVRDTAATYNHWRQMYLEYWNANLHRDGLALPAAVDRRLYTAPALPGLPLRVLHYRYQRLAPDAEARNLIRTDTAAHRVYDVAGRTASPYEEKRAVALGLPERRVYHDTIRFYVGRDQFFGNVAPETAALAVDFGDGHGTRPVTLGETYTIVYPTRGDKTIRLTWAQAGQTWQAATSLRVSSIPAPDRAVAVVATNAWPGQREFGRARAYIAAGASNPKVWDPTRNAYIQKVRKPLVFVEGIDFGPLGNDPSDSVVLEPDYPINSRTFHRVPFRYGTAGWPLLQEYDGEYPSLEKLPDLRARLQAAGYDVIFFDFNDGEALIQQNAMALVQFIRWLNNPVNHSDPTASVDVVVMGASMGGQVARFALTWMEQQGENHCGSLYVSFDSPHFGANVPLGLQFLLDDLSSLALTPADEDAALNRDKLDGPASQQMLRHHYNRGAWPRQLAWYDWIQNPVNWPTRLRKVAISNGSRNMVSQGYNAGSLMLETSSLGTAILGRKRCFAMAGTHISWNFGLSTRDNVVYWDRNGFPAAPVIKSVDSNTPFWDSAPGCIYNVASTIYDSAPNYFARNSSILDNCFMPTVSTLGVKVGAPNHPGGPDLWYNVQNHIPNADLPNPSEYAFDAYFAPDNNEPHVQITDGTRARNGLYGTPTHNNVDWLLRELNELNAELPAVLEANTLYVTYNYGNQFHKTLRSTTVSAGGRLFVNKYGIPVNGGPLSQNYTVVQPGTFVLPTRECGARVTVMTGGLFELGTAGATATTGYKAEVHFRAGSVLHVAGGQLKIQPFSKLVMEAGSVLEIDAASLVTIESSGQLVIEEQGAVNINGTVLVRDHGRLTHRGTWCGIHPNNAITLEGTDAVMELTGYLSIADNTIFTFSGSGEMHFNRPAAATGGNFHLGTNARFVLRGSGPTDRVARIQANTCLVPDNWGADAVMTVENASVFLGENAYLDFANSVATLRNATFAGTGRGYRSIYLRGCGRETVENCRFTGAQTGLTALLGDCNGANGAYESCTFDNCERGLHTDRKAATLVNCTFTGGGFGSASNVGWLMTGGSDRDSEARDCTFSGFNENLRFTGGVGTNLTLEGIQSSDGQYGAVYQSIGGTLTGLCGTIHHNKYAGLVINGGALRLNQAKQQFNLLTNGYLYNNPRPGTTEPSVLLSRSIILENATGLDLNQGFNQIIGLNPNTSGIIGTIRVTEPLGSFYTLDANRNRWNVQERTPGYGSSPPDVSVTVYQNSTSGVNAPLRLRDTSPVIPTQLPLCRLDPCLVPQSVRFGANIPCIIEREYQDCPDCEKITTSFVTDDSLQHAVLLALSYQKKYDATSTDVRALEMLHEILLLPLADTTAGEMRILNKAYGEMKSLYASSLGAATDAAEVEEIQMLLDDVIDQQLTTLPAADTAFLIDPKHPLLMDKAMGAYAAGNLTAARALLTEAALSVNPLNRVEYEYWDCYVGLAQQYQDSTLTAYEYAEQVQHCTENRRASRGVTPETPDQFLARVQAKNAARTAARPATTATFVTLAPNPTAGPLTLTFGTAPTGAAQAEIRALTGQVVRRWTRATGAAEEAAPTWTLDATGLPTGVYLLRVADGAHVSTQRLVVRP